MLKAPLKKRFAQLIALTLFATATAFPLLGQAEIAMPTLNIRQLTADTDIVNANANYVFAINGWANNVGTTYTVNGVNFLTVNNGTINYNGVPVAYQPQSSTGIASHGGNTGNNVASDQQLYNILQGMIYNGSQKPNTSVKLISNGLTPGKTYTLSLLTKCWTADSDNRQHQFTFDSNLDGQADSFALSTAPTTSVTQFTMSEDNASKYWSGISNSKPYLVEYTFVAQSNAIQMTDLGLNDNNSWHLYGASLYEHTDIAAVAMPALVSNGSFEADVYIETSAIDDMHGYSSKHNDLITGWTVTNPSRVGLGPSWKSSDQTTVVCNDFFNSNSQTAPDGKQVLYLQSSENVNGAVSQTINNLEAGEEYVLSYYAAYRQNKNRLPSYTVSMGTNTLESGVFTPNQFNQAQFLYKDCKFTAGQTSETLKFAVNTYTDSDSSNDRSLLLDNVQIVKASEYVAPINNNWLAFRWNSDDTSLVGEKEGAYTHAYNFGKAENVTINGTTFTGAARTNVGTSLQAESGNLSFISSGNHNGGYTEGIVTGESAKLAKETIYGCQNIVLNGLEPGATYETTIYLRSHGENANRTGTFTVNGNKSPTVYVDKYASAKGAGLLVSVSGVADDQGVIYIGVKNFDGGNTMHLSGISNQLLTSAPTGYNDNIVLKSQFTGANGTAVAGTAPDTLSSSLSGKKWVRRGQLNSDNVQTIDGNVIRTGYNNGLSLDVRNVMTTADTLCLSADLKVGTVSGTGSGAYNNARGVGIGFFDSFIGTNYGEAGRGFSGLVLMPDGALLYYENANSGLTANATTEALAWSGTSFSNNAWYNLAIEMETFDNGSKAKITGISLDGSTVDFSNSSLMGKVFNTTELAGVLSSSGSVNTWAYADNFQLRVLSTATPEQRQAQFDAYKAEFIANAGDGLLAATSFTGTSGTPVPGTSMDIANNLGSQNGWIVRGSANNAQQWNADGSNTNNLNPRFTIVGNEVKTSANSGIAMDYDSSNMYGMTISLDLMLGTLTGAEKNQSRGIGLGFFDSQIGTNSGEVGRGFSGLIVDPNGGLYYYDNQTDGVTNVNISDTVAYAGSTPFNNNSWYTLTMDLEFMGSGDDLLAQLVDVSLSGSNADYSSLIGSVFNTTDLLGILSSSATSWNYAGFVDNYRVDLKVPEPASILLILFGLGGLYCFRKRVDVRRS